MWWRATMWAGVFVVCKDSATSCFYCTPNQVHKILSLATCVYWWKIGSAKVSKWITMYIDALFTMNSIQTEANTTKNWSIRMKKNKQDGHITQLQWGNVRLIDYAARRHIAIPIKGPIIYRTANTVLFNLDIES